MILLFLLMFGTADIMRSHDVTPFAHCSLYEDYTNPEPALIDQNTIITMQEWRATQMFGFDVRQCKKIYLFTIHGNNGKQYSVEIQVTPTFYFDPDLGA